MKLVQLEYFIKTVECGSITKAASELYVSQPNLTKAIANLEAEYGVTLLERTPKGVLLTLKGREFLDYARDIINARSMLEDTFSGKKAPLVSRLCVASQQLDFLYDLIGRVCRENEMLLNVVLTETDRGTILKRLERRSSDIGILILTESDKSSFDNEIKKRGLKAHELDHSTVYVAVASVSELYDRQYLTVAETADYLHVALDMDEDMIRKLYLGETEGSLDRERVIFCNTVSACLHFMRSSGALLYIPKWVRGLLAGESDIHIIPLFLDEKTPYPKANHLAYVKREDEEVTVPEQRFIQLLSQEFSK